MVTPWGPLGIPDLAGHPRAVRWVGHTARAVNLGLLNLEGARDADEALTLAASLGIPAQNILVADRKGTIGWTLAGPIPRRQGSDGRLPSVSPRPGRWVGWLEPEDYPRILAPADHRLWTANNRVVAGEALALLGDGGLELGARAGQIRQGLTARDSFDEAGLLAIQLDYRAQFLARWRRLLLDTLGSETLVGHPQRAALRRVVAAGAKRAAVDDAGYRLVREFRAAVLARILEPVIQVVQAQGDGREPYRERLVQLEGALWQLVSHRPHHWLAPAYADWQALLLAAVDNVAAAVTRSTPDVADYTWGRHNTLAMAHPLSLVLPSLGDWLNMPPVPLPGDIHMPRVQRPGAGASVRLVVAPGREEQALCHMPGGQSGHPLSPFYRLGHAAWAAGEATPLLPGPAQHRLVLNPGS
ncbi:MAG: penicillin acylase family protein [Candidatus Competibacterales bacterium]